MKKKSRINQAEVQQNHTRRETSEPTHTFGRILIPPIQHFRMK